MELGWKVIAKQYKNYAEIMLSLDPNTHRAARPLLRAPGRNKAAKDLMLYK
jgi:hypothetical protein